MSDTKLPNLEKPIATHQQTSFSLEYLLNEACDYLTLGINELFVENTRTEQYHFLMVLQRLLQRLKRQAVSPDKKDAFAETLYQAESLSRLAADLIFLENTDGDRVNYLMILRDLLSEAREVMEVC